MVSIFDVVHVVPLTTSLEHTSGLMLPVERLMLPVERLRFEVCGFFVEKFVGVLVSCLVKVGVGYDKEVVSCVGGCLTDDCKTTSLPL